MFANQAIKSFKQQIKTKMNGMNDKGALANMEQFANNHIPKATKYHLGSDDMLGFIEKQTHKLSVDQLVFLGPAAIDVELPYDMCWFDFLDTKFLGKIDPVMSSLKLKCGIFAANMNPGPLKNGESRIIQITPMFVYGKTNSWVFANNTYIIKVGSHFNREEVKKIYKELSKPDTPDTYLQENIEHAIKSNFITVPMGDYVSEEHPELSFEAWWLETCNKIGFRCLSVINMFLMILNCKNVVTETINPTRKNKRNLKKYEGYTYKILKFKVPKSRQKYSNSGNGETIYESSMPLNTWTGHYKTYTEEAPLFGKVVGRWWWHSHVRGDEKNGTIDKDYHPILND